MTVMTVPSRSAANSAVEVSASGRRRRFTVEYKTRIVQEAAQCRAAGEVGSLLRREGLYSSQLTTWRKQYHAGARQALSQRRGPKPRADTETMERLQRENDRLRDQLARAELVISIQKKLSELLGLPQPADLNRAHT